MSFTEQLPVQPDASALMAEAREVNGVAEKVVTVGFALFGLIIITACAPTILPTIPLF
eukprot:COSAG04_NODE_131_length_24280_cov_40.563418_20_plen_58_part_00